MQPLEILTLPLQRLQDFKEREESGRGEGESWVEGKGGTGVKVRGRDGRQGNKERKLVLMCFSINKRLSK